MTRHASTAAEYHPWTTYIHAREEARRRGDRRVGTEHLVLALLRDSELAQALGCDVRSARDTLDAMDRDALVRIRIDHPLEAPPVPTREPVLGTRRPSLKAVLADRLPITPVAKRALEASGKDVRRFDPRRVLTALLSLAPPDPAAELLDALGVDRRAVGERLAQRSAA